jgi:hypothetical protein
MGADMLSELAHLYFLEATDWSTRRTARERTYLMRCSKALAVRAVKEGKRGK